MASRLRTNDRIRDWIPASAGMTEGAGEGQRARCCWLLHFWRYNARGGDAMQLELVAVTKDEDMNVIIGQTHFIKSVEDIYEAVVNAVPGVTSPTEGCPTSSVPL